MSVILSVQTTNGARQMTMNRKELQAELKEIREYFNIEINLRASAEKLQEIYDYWVTSGRIDIKRRLKTLAKMRTRAIKNPERLAQIDSEWVQLWERYDAIDNFIIEAETIETNVKAEPVEAETIETNVKAEPVEAETIETNVNAETNAKFSDTHTIIVESLEPIKDVEYAEICHAFDLNDGACFLSFGDVYVYSKPVTFNNDGIYYVHYETLNGRSGGSYKVKVSAKVEPQTTDSDDVDAFIYFESLYVTRNPQGSENFYTEVSGRWDNKKSVGFDIVTAWENGKFNQSFIDWMNSLNRSELDAILSYMVTNYDKSWCHGCMMTVIETAYNSINPSVNLNMLEISTSENLETLEFPQDSTHELDKFEVVYQVLDCDDEICYESRKVYATSKNHAKSIVSLDLQSQHLRHIITGCEYALVIDDLSDFAMAGYDEF